MHHLLILLIAIPLLCMGEIPLIPREVFFNNLEKSLPQLSPDGAKLAFLAPDQRNITNVWVDDQIVTSDAKRGIQFYRWEYDNQHILYIQDRDGDENWHLYETDIAAKTTRDLTPFDGVRAELIAYEPQFPRELLIQINRRNPGLFDVYRLNLDGGALELEVENDHNAIAWLADHRLQVRASQSFDQNGNTIIRVRDEKNGPWRELMRWGPEEMGGIVGFSHDNDSLFLIVSIDANAKRLITVDIATGSCKVIAEDPQYDLTEVMVNPHTHEVEAVKIYRERAAWNILDPAVKVDFVQLEKPDADLSIMNRDQKDEHWIVKYESSQHPPHYYLYDRLTRSSRFLFTTQPKLENYPLSPMTPISYTARDGMTLHGYLTLPLDADPKNLSTILFVHGGPWARDMWGCDPFVQWLANRGYAVLQVNYRGSTGYGKNYCNAGNKEWAGKMHTDLLDGKEWMIEQGYSNPDKVAILGGSYGGYAALVGMAFTPEEFCCGIDLVGPSNLVSLLETIPPYWNPVKSIFDIRVGNLETERAFLESCSPIFKVDQICRPLLIAQGANDPRVNQAESDQIVAALRQRGKEVEYLLFSDEGHGFSKPENIIKFCISAEYFLHKHLGGRLQPK